VLLIAGLIFSGCQQTEVESEAFAKYGQEFEGKIAKSYDESQEWCISTFSLSETFDVGIDAGTPVTTKYKLTNHYPYT